MEATPQYMEEPLPKLHDGPHLQIFNPAPAPKSSDSFHLFPKLPRELRDLIWWHSLARERLLSIYWHKEERAATNSSLISTSFVLSLHTRQGDPSPILLVNHESQGAALRFYRIRFPCYTSFGGEIKGIFYFNPDFDTLFLPSGIIRRGLDDFVAFAQELRDVDPRGLGLQQVAFLIEDVDTEAFETQEQSSQLRQVMSGICSVMLLVNVFRMHSSIPNYRDSSYFRSIPVSNNSAYFQRLPQDPRPIQEDLERISPKHLWGMYKRVLRDTRSFARHWNYLRDIMEIHSPCHHKFVLLSAKWDSRTTHVADLKEENRAWQQELIRKKVLDPTQKGEETYEELQAAPQTAVGFWIFPQEVLRLTPPDGSMGSDESLGPDEDPEYVLDLAAYHPELALFDLEEDTSHDLTQDDSNW